MSNCRRHQAELAHVARLSMMGEMAASLAHELNQPLHAVKNYAYGSICRLLKMPERDEELVVALEQISEEANRAAEIIRRVKGFVQKREPRFSEVVVNAWSKKPSFSARRNSAGVMPRSSLSLPRICPPSSATRSRSNRSS